MSEGDASTSGTAAAAPGAPRDAAAHHRRSDGPPADAPAGGVAADPLLAVRGADLEPYTGLRYLSKLFRLIAILLLLLLVAEVATGLARQGTEAIPTLVAEASRLIVLAGLLWGIGDLAILLIDVGHDVRAARILLARATAHAPSPTPDFTPETRTSTGDATPVDVAR